MAKSLIGIDIGHGSLNLALVRGRRVKRTVSVAMPLKLVQEGRVVSAETMGELIRNTMRENGMRARKAAIVLPNESTFVRNVNVPVMSADQLKYNLPFEFRDYITDELKDYTYDYAVLERKAPSEEEGSTGETLDLLAVAVHTDLLDDMRAILRKAGLHMAKAIPTVSSYISLIRCLGGDPSAEYCILDLGYRAVRMYMFRGDRHIVTRSLEIGLSALDDVIAGVYNVDPHLAHTYLLTNYENCQQKQECINSYNGIAVELMRALNFYRFS
ncbi:MAG: pilus assembly protein PilM, partial [Clostridia bacterium]|nr:pilus assembly protein PilM [Clostridia bacterium]